MFLLLGILTFSCNSNSQDPDNKKPMYGEVTKSNKYKKADDDFIKACLKEYKTIDSSVSVHIGFAWRYYYNGDLNTAMKRFNQAWLLNPEYPDSYFGFASLLESQGDTTEAKRFYKIGFKKDTNHNRAEECFQRIADCKEQLNDITGAVNAYLQITSINPENSIAFKKVGYFQMEFKNYDAAIIAYNRAIELDSVDEVTYNNRAYLYQSIENYDAAILDYSKAIKLNPKYISALVNRGITEMQLTLFKDAKSDFLKCVKLDSKSGELRRLLALSEIGLNEKSDACKDLEMALELGDQFASQLIKENCTGDK